MPDKSLIQKYLEGNASEEEARIVRDYLSSDDQDMHILLEYFNPEAWEDKTEANQEGNSVLRDRLLSDLREQLYPAFAGVLSTEAKVVHLSGRSWLKYAAMAASIVLIAGSAWWFAAKNGHLPGKETATAWKTIRNMDIRTRLGILPDGSQFYLTPNSTLSYAGDFKENRGVRLEGEAFFEVVKDDQHPFRVKTEHIMTQVLGTAFNIEAYKEERTVRVSLVQGKVAVRQDGTDSARVLQAGEALTYYKDSDKSNLETVKITNVLEWENGYTLFNEVPVTSALGRIARQYGMTLRIKGAEGLRDKHVTGVFQQQPLTQTLNIILFISQYKYRIQGDTINVFPK